MKKFGLPTYPIADGMRIGKRETDELEWLLAYGHFQSDIYRYRKIVKISAHEYRLSQCEDSRYDDTEKTICDANSLQTLFEIGHLDISHWYWYPEE